MAPHPQLRVALVGLGKVAAEHIQGWTQAGHIIRATVDPDPQAVRDISLIGCQDYLTELDAVLTRPDIDVVDLCTPHHLHWPQIMLLAEWPGAILVEKPLVTNRSELSELQALMGKRAHPILMRTNKRFQPHGMQLASALHSAATMPLQLRIVWRQRPEYMATRQWYRRIEVSGGGVLLGMGIHYLDVLAEHIPSLRVSDVVLQTHRFGSNAPDTTSETFARVRLTSAHAADIDMLVTCRRDSPAIPYERIRGTIGDQSIALDRRGGIAQPSSVRPEFEWYGQKILADEAHPSAEVMIRSHALAFSAYDLWLGKQGGLGATQGEIR